MSIIKLEEVARNQWKARYEGNYGVYLIKMKFDGDKLKNFSCSCPSEYSPCKHIAMIESEIRLRRAIGKNASSDAPRFEQLLTQVSHEELKQFFIQQASYSKQLANDFMLQFGERIPNTSKGSSYRERIRNLFKGLEFSEHELYNCDTEIEGFDDWLEQGRSFTTAGKYEDAASLAKACIEEFADWLYDSAGYEVGYFSNEYIETPFDILLQIANVDEQWAKEIYAYCQQEIQKPKYESTYLDAFQELLFHITPAEKEAEFIALQDQRLSALSDKTGYQASEIVQRKIDFYKRIGNPQAAQEVIMNNLHIDRIARQQFKTYQSTGNLKAAKILAEKCLQLGKHSQHWLEQLFELAITQQAADDIRKYAHTLLLQRFNDERYKFYKASIPATEREKAREDLLSHYQKQASNSWGNSISENVALLLIAERLYERLFDYIKKKPSLSALEKYHLWLVDKFPAETLDLFSELLQKYAIDSIGRDHYEYIASIMRLMKSINGGAQVVAALKTDFGKLYKNRRAMQDILKSV